MFEDIVLRRSQGDILNRINKQQGGFQDGLSCMMTSVLIHEAVHFASENSSKLYVAFMDGKKAFDVVWHGGLLYKLVNQCNLDPTTSIACRAM